LVLYGLKIINIIIKLTINLIRDYSSFQFIIVFQVRQWSARSL